MAKKLILLFSHTLTKAQEEDAKNTLGVTEFVFLTSDLQQKWSNVPDDLESITNYLSPIVEWLNSIVNKNDFILIQGDFGATYYFVNWAFKNNAQPIYSTTKRVHIENKIGRNKIEIKKSFQHTIYRKYQSEK